MPIPPPSQDIEAALLGLAAILDRAVEQVHRVIAEVKAEDSVASEDGADPDKKAGPSDDI